MEVLAGVSGLGTMLVIAGTALVLGLVALWLARRRSHQARREETERHQTGRPDDQS